MHQRFLLAPALLGFSLIFGAAHAQISSKTPVVQVRLSEWTMGMASMTIKGVTEFAISNAGKYPHVFTVAGTFGGKPLLISSALLKAGEKTTLTISLPAGKYQVYCPIPGHADQGMKGTLTVQ